MPSESLSLWSCGECGGGGSGGRGGGDGAGWAPDNKPLPISARSSCTWLSSSVQWTVCVASTAPFPSHVAHAALYTFYLSPRATYALIYSMHAPDRKYPPHLSQQAQL